jgi:hypothetical protein
MGCFGYFSILAAIPGFFLSSLFVMLLWNGLVVDNFEVDKISYALAMLITITTWIAVAPLAAVSGRGRWWRRD